MKRLSVIKCSSCDWQTKPHFYESDCVKEKELEHYSTCHNTKIAHDKAFTNECPRCEHTTFLSFVWG